MLIDLIDLESLQANTLSIKRESLNKLFTIGGFFDPGLLKPFFVLSNCEIVVAGVSNFYFLKWLFASSLYL